MSIVDKINEKTGKFANNIAEAVADLLGKEVKATTIVENIGDGNNIQEAIDNLSGKQSANIMEAIDNYNGDDIPKSMTIEEALENTEGPGPGPGPEPTEKVLFRGGAVEVQTIEGSAFITPLPVTPVFDEPYTGDVRVILHNYQGKIGDGEWEVYPTYETYTTAECTSADSFGITDFGLDNGAYMSIDNSDARYTYENSDAERYSKWDSMEILTTNEEAVLEIDHTNLQGVEGWKYSKPVNNGDILHVRLKDMVGHIGSETEAISDIDVTGTVDFEVGIVDNFTFIATNTDNGGLIIEVDPDLNPRYDGGIGIGQIIVTRIPNETTANSTTPNFNSMTKADIQAWAGEHNISGVDQNSQTKAQMIEIIEAALNA